MMQQLLMSEELSTDELESLAYGLLEEIWAGYPPKEIHRLLTSDNDTAVNAGAWIISELGGKASSLMSDVKCLLEHPSPYARFFALDAVLSNATSDDGSTVARAVKLTYDPDGAVRWKSLGFMTDASPHLLRAAVPYLTDSPAGALTTWLIHSRDEPVGIEELRTKLNHPDRLTEAFGAVAAALIADTDPSALKVAAESTADEIASFAKSQLGRLRRRQSRSV